jgi:signal transduction histidine kinase
MLEHGEDSHRKTGGLGLGLTTARSLVEPDGGTVQALSEGMRKAFEAVR